MKIILPGNPIPMQRPRAVNRGRHAGIYDPQSKLKLQKKKLIKEEFLKLWLEEKSLVDYFSSPLYLLLSYHMPISDSDSRPTKNAKLWGSIMPSIKPDLDNLVKLTCDLCNGIIWKDDAQIVTLHATQKYSNNPCTEITVIPIQKSMNENQKKMTQQFTPEEIFSLNSDLMLLNNYTNEFLNSHESDNEAYLEGLSVEMIKFAEKYAHKLKKMVRR